MSLQTIIQAWKSQPVFVSIIGGDAAVAWQSHAVGPASLSAFSACRPASSVIARHFSGIPGSDRRTNSAQTQAGAQDGSKRSSSNPSLWASLQRALFPIQGSGKPSAPTAAGSTTARGSAVPAAAASSRLERCGSANASAKPSPSDATARASVSAAALPAAAAAAARAAREAARDSRRTARGTSEDAFTALSKPAERFSGALLKAAVLLITVPFGVHMLTHSLMMSLCVRGLEADRPETVALTLRRVRSVVVSDYLADRFESEDGVGLLMATFHERTPEAVLREFLLAADQLLRFRSTREALLMSSLLERLERAQSVGWLPPGLREQAHQLYLDAHAARRMEMGMDTGTDTGGKAEAEPGTA